MTNSSISLIGRIHDHAHQWLTGELASAGLPGIVPSHGDILAFLFLHGEAPMHELAAFAHRTRPTTTVLISKLERMGLVRHRRSTGDARSVIVSLTPKGEELRTIFEDISQRLVGYVTAGLSAREADDLEKLLGKVLAGMEKNNNHTENDNEGNQEDR